MSWVIDYMEDIESDLSVFHRIDDPAAMISTKFFSYVTRLGAYEGALAARIEQEMAAQSPQGPMGQMDSNMPQELPDDAFLAQHADLFTDK